MLLSKIVKMWTQTRYHDPYLDPVRRAIDRLIAPIGCKLDARKMQMLGARNTMRLAKAYNKFLYGRCQKYRNWYYQEYLKNPSNPLRTIFLHPKIEIKDGWAIDHSMTLPGLTDLLKQADDIIAEKGNKTTKKEGERSFFVEIVSPEELDKWPTLINFITYPEILSIVANYLKFIPVLSKPIPHGIRFVESGKHIDALAHLPPRETQLYHIDPYDYSVVYVIVLLRDCTIENGPFTFLSASDSTTVAKHLNYRARGVPHKLTDEQVYSVVPKEKRHELTYPRGTVLFVDACRCLHYGAREGVKPRFQMMYAFTSACRSDFVESFTATYPYPIKSSDPELRQLVLNRSYLPSTEGNNKLLNL